MDPPGELSDYIQGVILLSLVEVLLLFLSAGLSVTVSYFTNRLPPSRQLGETQFMLLFGVTCLYPLMTIGFDTLIFPGSACFWGDPDCGKWYAHITRPLLLSPQIVPLLLLFGAACIFPAARLGRFKLNYLLLALLFHSVGMAFPYFLPHSD